MHDVQHREVKKLPGPARPHGDQHVLRGLDAHPLELRDRRQVALRRRHQHLRQGLHASKGECLRDTVLTVCAMGVDGLVIRHPASRRGPAGQPSGSTPWSSTPATGCTSTRPRRCSTPTRCSAGSARSRASTSCIVGDLTHSRVFRSNVLCLTKLGAHVTVVAPPTLMPSGIDRVVQGRRVRDVVRPRRRCCPRPTR